MLPYSSSTPSFSAHAATGDRPERRTPQKALMDAIGYAHKTEIAALVDRAVADGANLFVHNGYDNHLLVLATRENNPHAIRVLMARGLSLPNLPPSNVNLLMEAAERDQPEMVRVLLDIAHLDPDYQDDAGWTTLHHAVIGRSTASVKMLVEFECELNTESISMTGETLRTTFGPGFALDGAGITPLMIACAQGDHEIVSLLLAAGADPHAGRCTPLVVAGRRGHVAVVSELLSKGARLHRSHDENQHGALVSLLTHGAPPDCIKLVVAHHDFSRDDGKVSSPLGTAVEHRNEAALAMMLGYGARVEENRRDAETLWDRAAEVELTPGHLLDLMAMTCLSRSPGGNLDDLADDLDWLILYSSDPGFVASQGRFCSLFAAHRPYLEQLRHNDGNLTDAQQRLEAAFYFERRMIIPPAGQDIPGSGNLPLDRRWVHDMRNARHAQASDFKNTCSAYVQRAMRELRHALSIEFLLECERDCPDDDNIVDFMQERLQQNHGLPVAICTPLIDAWRQAAQWAAQSNIPADAVADRHSFLGHAAWNLLQDRLQAIDGKGNLLVSDCRQTALDALSSSANPLADFCRNPVVWLRKFEQRSHLRAVQKLMLSDAIQIALGLPNATCRAIVNAWAAAVDAARRPGAWRSPAELERVLARQLAGRIAQAMDDDAAWDVIPGVQNLALSHWVTANGQARPAAASSASSRSSSSSASSSSSSSASSSSSKSASSSSSSTDTRLAGKRPATGEPDGAPPGKKPRD